MNTVRMIRIENEEEIPEGLKDLVSFQIEDNKIEAVVIKSGKDFIRITKSEAYSNNLKISKTQPMKSVTRYRVHGTMFESEVIPKLFDTEFDAECFRKEREVLCGHNNSDLRVEEFVELKEESKF